ncbi:RHS repeat-associated core domain-containing protein [Luteimonas sp. 8-5]|uniref:RHS repeat-associated core domain-containing protein n=1 Tax=Luteimonas sp. 8-5 TaxID=3039387 RepID=UPI002436F6B3|nr:RHS repeat-associated core domain-containing protein [Luteimonas sp. 8-5]MDG6349581.1 RHS repeat-associated core domain-containing protein [Luteimonas sp. 8-5]
MGGSLVAERSRPIGSSTETVTYQHTDALGSPVATTNSAKTVLQRSEYEPYGFLANRPMQDGPGYTGHITDAATGLVYMQQRYYDPSIGRFLSVDVVTARVDVVGQFHRYRYANGNPYRFVDIDGRQANERRKTVISPGPVDCADCDIHPQESDDDPEMSEPVIVVAPRFNEAKASFFQLTTFMALRKDMSQDQAIRAGELTRTITLPALIFAASPDAIALAASTTPAVGEGILVGARYAPGEARRICLAAGLGAAICDGKGGAIVEDILNRTRQREEVVEAVRREVLDRANRRSVSP